MLYTKEVKFYETIQNIAIHEMALQNLNCHKYSIKEPLLSFASNSLNINDSQVPVQTSFGEELEKAMKSESAIE